jgi:putative transposase
LNIYLEIRIHYCTALQIVPALADKGMYIASESTMYRILKNENMQHHRGRSKKSAPRSKPDTYIASDSNQVWTWDITYLNTFVRGLYYKLYMILDIFSRKIVGWEVWPEESGEYAAVLVERAFVDEKIGNAPLVLHSDNGSPMKALTLKTKLESLGIISSYSRPRVSNDNPYSEALFRTCKYCSEYPTEGFESVDSAREWVNGFVEWYNNKHYHSGLNFVTPNTRHNGTAIEIMKKREIVYNTAKKLHPERWTGNTRNWELPETVALNPTREITSHVKNTS